MLHDLKYYEMQHYNKENIDNFDNLATFTQKHWMRMYKMHNSHFVN